MAWSDEFLAALDKGEAPMFALDFDFFGWGDFATYESTKPTLHTHGLDYGTNPYPHAIAEISGAGQSVSVSSWSSNAGGLRVQLAGVEVANYVAQNIPRGLTCRLMMGFEGLDWYRWGRLGTYVYEGLSGSNNRWMMKFGGLLKALQTNQNKASTTSGFGVTATATADSDHDIDAGPYDIELKLSDSEVDDFFVPGGSAGFGVARITPDPDSSETATSPDFYIAYTSAQKAPLPPKLLGCQSGISILGTVANTRFDVYGTDRHIADGDLITHVNYVWGSLPDFAKRWLRGDAADSDPNSNIGVSVDIFDWEIWKNRWLRYGDFTVDHLGDKYEKNAVSPLLSIMGKMGAWLVNYQGKMSFRFAQDLTYASGAAVEVDYEIGGDDIISMDKYDVYHPDRKDQKVSIGWVAFPGADSAIETRTASVVTQPATEVSELLAGHIFNDSANNATSGNVTKAAEHLSDRLNPWMRRVPDQLTLNLRGWSWLRLVPGDVCLITCDYIPDFYDKDTEGVSALNMEHFMVCGVNPNWKDFSVTVEFTRLPRKHNPYL